MAFDDFSEEVIGGAIAVHRELGPGLPESVYEACLARELEIRNIPFNRQVALPIRYKGETLEQSFRIDMIVADRLIVEIKATEKIVPIHEAQFLTYLRLSGIRNGLIRNFAAPTLAQGLKRMVL